MGSHVVVYLGFGGDDKDGGGGEACTAANFSNEAYPIHLRHHDVGEDEIGDDVIEELEGFAGAMGNADVKTGCPEDFTDNRAKCNFIVDDQDGTFMVGRL